MRRKTLVLYARLIIGCVWLAGALFNLTWSLRHPAAFTDSLATDATFPVFRWFFGDIMARSPALWIALLIIAEIGLGILTLSQGTGARVGLAASALFSAFLFLVIWPYTLMMGVWAILALWLARYDHPRSMCDFVHRRLHAGQKSTGGDT